MIFAIAEKSIVVGRDFWFDRFITIWTLEEGDVHEKLIKERYLSKIWKRLGKKRGSMGSWRVVFIEEMVDLLKLNI